MAKIIIQGTEHEINDGQNLADILEEAGVPVGCREGMCGGCEIEVLEGGENLSDPTEAETDYPVEGNHRLGCQCTIKGGCVKVDY